MSLSVAPEGFVWARTSGAQMLVDRRYLDQARAAGLDRPEGWSTGASGGQPAAGRGSTSTLKLASGSMARIKQLRRGGLTRHVWRERFAGTARLVRNLEIPLHAIRRGIPTPRPIVLLLVGGPPGLFRGWLATENVSDAVDLAARVRGGSTPTPAELEAVMRTVREMHDRGLDHRDLNLGNLLLRGAGSEIETFVIDLDGCELQEGPVSFERRQRALRRLERSYVKVAPHADPRLRESLYAAYAANDRALAQRLERGRRGGRLRVFIHRASG